MRIEDLDGRWHELAEEVMTGMKEWRLQHPKATFREIEAALDERLGRLRARMLEDALLVSRAAEWEAEQGERPVCPRCGTSLERGGKEKRELTTQHNQVLRLERRYGLCPQCDAGVFPLDEELELLAGHFTPSVYEGMTRLGTWMPFERAVKELEYFWRVTATEATLRRQAEAAGAAYVQVQDQEVARLEREAPPAPQGPDKQFLSVDGAKVPLVGGEWAEVKTLAVGEVTPPVQYKGETVIQTCAMSYFSRLTEAKTFQRLALVETHRRGVETAGSVGAVTDGAEWCQGFVDFHRPDAVRILDFPHAGEHLGQVGQAAWGEGAPAAQAWLTDQLHHLKHDGPVSVLAGVRQLEQAHPDQPTIMEHLAYLEKREPHMQYPLFQSAGWPIGDGAVESGNKLVVEARLKGAGMHWARPHVDPMVALRNIACNDRWEEAWPQIATELRRQTAQRRTEQRQKRQARRCEATRFLPETTPPTEPALVTPTPEPLRTLPEPVAPSAPDKPKQPWRPAANHPWRRPVVLKTKRQLAQPRPSSKL